MSGKWAGGFGMGRLANKVKDLSIFWEGFLFGVEIWKVKRDQGRQLECFGLSLYDCLNFLIFHFKDGLRLFSFSLASSTSNHHFPFH